jgi:hypothetical protein
MIARLIRDGLLLGGLLLLAGLLPAALARPAQAEPLPPLLSGRNCGSTVLAALTGRPAGLSQDARWNDSRRVAIDDPQGSQLNPAIATSADGTLHLLFNDARNGDDDIFAARSSDGGQTWSAGAQVSDAISGTVQIDPAIWVAANGTIHAAWRDDRRGQNDIYTAYSSDGGQSWSENVRANLDNGSEPRSAPQLLGTADTLLAGWWQRSVTGAIGGNLVIVRSNDGGESWERTEPINALADSVFDGGFDLGLDPATGRSYAVWLGIPAGAADARRIMLAYSDDNGANWSPPRQINAAAETARKAAPALAVGENRLLAAWEDYRDGLPQIRLIGSSDGENWTASRQVNSAESFAAYDPRLLIDSRGQGHCVYCEELTGGGANIVAAEIDAEPALSREPISDEAIGFSQSRLRVAIDRRDNMYAFWTNSTVDGEGMFAASRPGAQHMFYLPIITQTAAAP